MSHNSAASTPTAPEPETSSPVSETCCDIGIKHDHDKPNWSLLPLSTVEDIVRVLDHGATKYAPHNWKKMEDPTRFFSAAMRHLTAYQTGELLDPDSKLPHLSHAACNLIFLLWHTQQHHSS